MKPNSYPVARWREARRAGAQRRREARLYPRASSANMNRLRAEAGMAADDRHRAFGTVFGGG
jgi:hypothetical protein